MHCPRCGLGISAKHRGRPHPKRLTRRQRAKLSTTERRQPRPVCPALVR